MIGEYVTIVVGPLVIILIVVYVYLSERSWRQARDTIVNAPDPRLGRGPGPKPLTPDEKIDALYQLSKRQGRSQFISNLAWAVVGILGGYLAGHFLPH